MSALTVSTSAHADASSSAAKKSSQNDAADGFLALLDISRNSGSFDAGDDRLPQAQALRRKEDGSKILAAPVAPVPLQIDNNEPKRAADTVEKSKKVELVDEPAQKTRTDRPEKKSAPKDEPVRPAKETSKPEEKQDVAPAEDTKASVKTEKTEEPKAAASTEEVEEASSMQAADQTNAVEEAGPVNPTGQPVPTIDSLFGRIQNLITQFFKDLNDVISGGKGKEGIFTLIRDFQANLQQAVSDYFAALRAGTPADAPGAPVENTDPTATTEMIDGLLTANQTNSDDAATNIIATSDAAVATATVAKTDLKLELPELKQSAPQADVVVAKPQADKAAAPAAVANAAPAVAEQTKDDALKQSLASSPLPVAQAAATQEAAKPVVANNTHNDAAVNAAPVAARAVDNSSADFGSSQRDSGGNLAGSQATFGPQAAAGSRSNDNIGGATFARLLSQTSHAPVAEQVAVQIKTLLGNAGSQIRIQLAPEELGKVDIRMHVMADGKTGMVITADNKETLDMLQRDRANLEQALTDAGLKADAGSLSFNLRGGQQEQAGEQRFGRGMPAMPNILPEEEELIGLATLSKNYVVEWHEGLDIKI